jgi:nicotinamide N-methyltransferase
MDLEEGLDLFQEDEEDVPLFQSALRQYNLRNGQSLKIRLVTQHSLWAHVLYPSGIVLAQYLEDHAELCCDKCILELGAAAGLPSLVAASLAAKQVGTSR